MSHSRKIEEYSKYRREPKIEGNRTNSKKIREKELEYESYVGQNVVDDIFQSSAQENEMPQSSSDGENGKDFFLDPETNNFKPPEWVKRPDYTAVMDAYKGIDFVDCTKIYGKGWYLIGRNPTVCDVILDHASISRKHAAILYHFSGAAYVVDLGSAHGTYLGRRRLRPFQPRLLKSGKLLKFGASTRYYVFQAFLTPAVLEKRELKTNPLIYEGGWEGGEDEKRQLCLNTLLNRRINDCLPPYTEKEPKKNLEEVAEEEGVIGKHKGGKCVVQKLRFLKAKEYIPGFWDQFGEEDSQGGRFSQLVQTTVIEDRQANVFSNVKKRPPPGGGNQISAAEKRRRQMALMSKGVSQINVLKKPVSESTKSPTV
mmetsp:Transcript_1387/g.1886  ORF Transcript_1387/g.1886 Transcript_1387/m.1886 type:complete len:370 (-) Transcript_1387:257-1366(-)|eukprot:CAMPEP_0117759714 /NCGR_PEP_ID=MMETSP0947-20121206/16175_1 /TAXON_ID=44440 /ORGANISM="Chattonella subsalsa, Strain CCMP2191" /LENGTH=369 /DNA_ID=CAMNT_0005580219 /DNA_START=28 /DNA_END=1137 /DNA_ORIENTATION=+